MPCMPLGNYDDQPGLQSTLNRDYINAFWGTYPIIYVSGYFD
jgi:hypothetical protein